MNLAFLPPRDRTVTTIVGVASGAAVAALSAIYVMVLAAGLLTLPTPDTPITDPWFTILEILILLIAPCMVGFSIALQAWAPESHRALGSIAVVFFGICAAITMMVHAVVLFASRHATGMDPAVVQMLFSFQWPSVVYVLDILAWDLAFPIGALAAAGALAGKAAPIVRFLLAGSSLLAFAGLFGAALGDMQLRNIGIAGYAFLFPVAAGIMAGIFRRELRSGTG